MNTNARARLILADEFARVGEALSSSLTGEERERARDEFKLLVMRGAAHLDLTGSLIYLLRKQQERRAGNIPRVVLTAPAPPASLDLDEWIDAANEPDDTEPVCFVVEGWNETASQLVINRAKGRDARLLGERSVWAAPLASWLAAKGIRQAVRDYVNRPPTDRLPTLAEYLATLP